MRRVSMLLGTIAAAALVVTISGRATALPLGSNPPVFQELGMLDTVAGNLTEADCRGCHTSGVPDRHHLLYGQALPAGTLIPYPDGSTVYNCLGCHSDQFVVERDCKQCHNAGSPHHTTQAAFDRHCTQCHGSYVADFDDGHYIPTYSASLVTPWRGLNGDGYFNAPYPTPDLISDGTGTILRDDFLQSEAGPPYFSVNSTPFDVLHTRNQPAVLAYKPAGFNNDVILGSPGHGGEEYSVIMTAGSPLAASWDPGTQTLSLTIDVSQTANDLVNEVNAATGGSGVEATLGWDGDDPVADRLPDIDYEPIGGNPPNNRGYGAGSCSYCHDDDGTLDANGDPAPALILTNHDTHHGAGLPLNMSDGAGGSWRRCNVCHDYTDRASPNPATYHDQSGPAFDVSIRICEECHSPETLHNIQADSDGNGVVIGGELAGYGHVGRDMGPGDSDCWGCHGFASGAATAPLSGPIIPTIYSASATVVSGGSATSVSVSGAAFTNTAPDAEYSSAVKLTAADGSSVTLTPDAIAQDQIGVTIPADTAGGNYDLQAVKAGLSSNPAVISVLPEVVVLKATGDRRVTIVGKGFGGYAAGSGTSVTGTANGGGATAEARIVSWSDTKIRAIFDTRPDEVTVNSVFGSTTAVMESVTMGGPGKRGKARH